MGRWKHEKPSKHAAYMREWFETEKGKEAKEKHRLYMYEYRKKNGDKVRKQQRECYRKARMEALEYYGGKPPKCKECEESRLPCLSLDHINNNGAEHRREMAKEYGKLNGNQILFWLRKNNYPEGFQILCYNCNIIKEMTKRKELLN